MFVLWIKSSCNQEKLIRMYTKVGMASISRVVCKSIELARSRCYPSVFLSSIPNFNMSRKETPHLKAGDAQPPLKKGLQRIYNMRFCPYAQRAILVLDAKGIPYDVVNCNLTTKPEWLFDKSQGGKVPALEFEDGRVMGESLLIADYLDEVHLNPPLYPADPLDKALDRLLVEKYNDAIRKFYRIVLGENGFTEENFEELVQGLEVLEKEIARRGTRFLSGNKPGMVDFMIWPWIERAPMLQILKGDTFELPRSRLPKLLEWRDAMLADPIVSLSALPPATHVRYLQGRSKGEYDFLVESHL